MFNLDFIIFSLIYKQCLKLGLAFGYGAFEGFILYAGVIVGGILTVTKDKVKQ